MMEDSLYGKDAGGYFRTYIDNPYATENTFIQMAPKTEPLPTYEQARALLPEPVWDGHPDALQLYNRCWEIAFGNLRRPHTGSGLVRPYIEPGLNGHLFLWDTVFMLFFGLYGAKAFPFQQSLDNFYARQHPDGFICREVDETTGQEQFHRYDPSSTGPNLLAWSEWRYYRFTGDGGRLKRVFPVIAGYHRWMRLFRTWQDGSYFASGWGCGMDNQPRFRQPYRFEFFHGFNSWIDTTCQQVLSARLLVRMAEATGRLDDADEFRLEAGRLERLINDRMWNESLGFYADKYADGQVSDVMTIGAYWALLAGVVPPERLARFTAPLEDTAAFNRPHRVPTLAANSPYYEAAGGYWRGGVWAPTNYMVLEGLSAVGLDSLARDIAVNHFGHVLEVFLRTGTVYENYAPEYAGKGSIAAPEFVGWTGLSGISILLEYILGIRADVPSGRIIWNIRQCERHGVLRYPFGKGYVDLLCEARGSAECKPPVTVRSTVPLTLTVYWPGGSFFVRATQTEQAE